MHKQCLNAHLVGIDMVASLCPLALLSMLNRIVPLLDPSLIASQEYLPRIKENDVLRAVEKNSSGSRPKELFEEVLEEVDKQWEADRWMMSAVLALHFLLRPCSQLVPGCFLHNLQLQMTHSQFSLCLAAACGKACFMLHNMQCVCMLVVVCFGGCICRWLSLL